VCFQAHTGKNIDVDGGVVRARWADCGHWQGMRVERNDKDTVVRSGDSVYLMAHTGKYIDVEGDSVQARWTTQGDSQKLTIVSEAGGSIRSGDAIFLTAHTAKLLDAGSETVQARYEDSGDWQKFVIQSQNEGAEIHDGDRIALRAYTGKFVDVEGSTVRARWYERGLLQSFTIEKHYVRMLQQIEELPYPDDEPDMLGVVRGAFVGLIAAACMVTLAIIVHSRCKQDRDEMPTTGSTFVGNKVHPFMGHDELE